ncbi:hypothetical protein GCM10027454_01470 [Algoriphagus aestuariicola]
MAIARVCFGIHSATFGKFRKRLVRPDPSERYPDYEELAAQVDALDEKYPLVAITCLRDNEENIRNGIGDKYNPILWLGEGTGFQEKYFMSRLPTTVLIDPQGKVVKYFRYHEKIDLEEAILSHQN